MESGTALTATILRIASSGWAPATGGNFSALIARAPLRMLMAPSGVDKSLITAADLIEVSADGHVLAGKGAASAETALHRTVYEMTDATCVLHTHSVWNTLLSQQHEARGLVTLSGYEMLKALRGVGTHEHREEIRIFKNSQDIDSLAEIVREYLADHNSAQKTGAQSISPHGFLIAGHGLYAWGQSIAEALRHVEALEFLFEVEGRK